MTMRRQESSGGTVGTACPKGTVQVLTASHWVECFAGIILFNPHYGPVGKYYPTPTPTSWLGTSRANDYPTKRHIASLKNGGVGRKGKWIQEAKNG